MLNALFIHLNRSLAHVTRRIGANQRDRVRSFGDLVRSPVVGDRAAAGQSSHVAVDGQRQAFQFDVIAAGTGDFGRMTDRYPIGGAGDFNRRRRCIDAVSRRGRRCGIGEGGVADAVIGVDAIGIFSARLKSSVGEAGDITAERSDFAPIYPIRRALHFESGFVV